MPSKDRVIEIFIAAVHRKPEAKDMLAINGMAKPYIDELAIKETFEGLHAGEQERAKREAITLPDLKVKELEIIVNDKKVNIELKPELEPAPKSDSIMLTPEKTKKNYKKTKAKSITAKKIKSMAKSKTKAKVKAKRKPKKW